MNHKQIVKQSKSAYKQWCVQWRKHAKFHSAYPMKPFEDFRNTGVGKAILCVANGYSFEEQIETIKKHKDNVDVICCDKTLGHLLNNGITPTFCVVCDANVNYETYLKPYEDQLKDVILFQNVCGNPDWTVNGNWKDIYFYTLKDVLKNEVEFIKLSGCPNVLTAGTNVSNMMVVMLNQSDNQIKQNLFSYDKILLIGYDYSWNPDGKYYAFDKEGGGKFYYMRHIYGVGMGGKFVYTSTNLNSSASWLDLYIKAFKLNTIQCNRDAIRPLGKIGKLEEQMQYRHKTSDALEVQEMFQKKQSLEKELYKIDNRMRDIAKDHWYASNRI